MESKRAVGAASAHALWYHVMVSQTFKLRPAVLRTVTRDVDAACINIEVLLDFVNNASDLVGVKVASAIGLDGYDSQELLSSLTVDFICVSSEIFGDCSNHEFEVRSNLSVQTDQACRVHHIQPGKKLDPKSCQATYTIRFLMLTHKEKSRKELRVTSLGGSGLKTRDRA